MESKEAQSRNEVFYRMLEETIGRLPAEMRARLYRPCAETCVRDGVLVELRRQFEERRVSSNPLLVDGGISDEGLEDAG